MERVVVVGGAGFIGSRCVAALETAGCAVAVVDSFFTGRRENVSSPTVTVIRGDPRDPSVHATAAEHRPDAVLYVGGVTDTRIGDAAWMLRETLEPFRAVTDWARRWSCRLVYASSAATYGNGPVPMTEAQPPSPHNAYGWAKLAMEHLANDLASEGTSLLGLRYFNVYGPGEAHKGETASMVRQLALQLRDNSRARLFEDGRQRRDFVHIDDVVRATIMALDCDLGGVVNIGSGREHSFDELASTVARAIGQTELRCEYVPAPPDYQARTLADTSRAADALGFEARVPFAEGVSSYATAVVGSG